MFAHLVCHSLVPGVASSEPPARYRRVLTRHSGSMIAIKASIIT